MQNQSSSARPSFRNPTALNTFARSSYLVATDARNFTNNAGASEEPWTSYDGLGPPQDPQHNQQRSGGGGRGRQDQLGSRNWRNQSPPRSWNQTPRNNQRGAPSKRNKQPVQPPKRPKKSTAVAGGGGGGGAGGLVGRPTGREVIDEAYLRKTYPRFDPKEYKDAPRTLTENPKAFLWDMKQITTRSSFANTNQQWSKCTVIITLNNAEQVTAVGEAASKVSSHPWKWRDIGGDYAGRGSYLCDEMLIHCCGGIRKRQRKWHANMPY